MSDLYVTLAKIRYVAENDPGMTKAVYGSLYMKVGNQRTNLWQVGADSAVSLPKDSEYIIGATVKLTNPDDDTMVEFGGSLYQADEAIPLLSEEDNLTTPTLTFQVRELRDKVRETHIINYVHRTTKVTVYFYVAEPVNSLSLLTYNTHLFEGSSAEAKTGMITRAYEQERRAELVHRLQHEGQADIVCLQEVWSVKLQKKLANSLRDFYRYVHIWPKNTISSVNVRGTSGLMVASQYAIKDPQFKMFHDVEGNDALAQKGVLKFAIDLPTGEGLVKITIGATHCPVTNPQKIEKALGEAARFTFADESNDCLLVGDFNIDYDYPNRRGNVKVDKIMAQYQAEDLVSKLLGDDLEVTYTFWQTGNTLAQALAKANGMTRTDGQRRLDYVYFRPGLERRYLHPTSAAVFHNWRTKGIDVSDHYPVFVDFGVFA